jgi:hypothetical protein
VECSRKVKKKPIKTKWILKKKRFLDGWLDSFKARLIALGCRQIEGIGYGERFAPVATFEYHTPHLFALCGSA